MAYRVLSPGWRRIAAYGYATFYSVTDVIVGIAGGELTQFNAARGLPERTVEVDRLIMVGNDVGEIGVWWFVVACAATAVAVVVRVGRRALPGGVVLLIAGCCSRWLAHLLAGRRGNDACARGWAWAVGCGPARSAAARQPSGGR